MTGQLWPETTNQRAALFYCCALDTHPINSLWTGFICYLVSPIMVMFSAHLWRNPWHLVAVSSMLFFLINLKNTIVVAKPKGQFTKFCKTFWCTTLPIPWKYFFSTTSCITKYQNWTIILLCENQTTISKQIFSYQQMKMNHRICGRCHESVWLSICLQWSITGFVHCGPMLCWTHI